jgi:phosphoribosylaminoimidazolecarboxamide formyltransferase/IMP cyclohydrolase
MSERGTTAVRRALISVYDKTNLVELGRGLAAHGVEILSTGGTARALRSDGIAVTEIADHTGSPEIMDGRVKTLHGRIHGGILGRRSTDAAAMAAHDIAAIDLVAVNLYPFAEVVADPQVGYDEALEYIDIGGPAMLRAAAKNHADVTVVTDPADYRAVVETLAAGVPVAMRQRLALKAFEHSAHYDGAVANWLAARVGDGDAYDFPPQPAQGYTHRSALRYGENPHQRGAFYVDPSALTATVAHARQHQGTALSFNNIADADTALECVKEFDEPACAIVKHANPCGVATAADLSTAYERAHACDPSAAFGGVVAVNGNLDGALASTLLERQFVEVIVATGYSDAALTAAAAKPRLRLLEAGAWAPASGLEFRGVAGGLLVQDRDTATLDMDALETVTRRTPDDAGARDLVTAWLACKHVKSNAIVYARDGQTVGIGAGQVSRIDAAHMAARKAQASGLGTGGAVLASDAFIPFRDVVDAAAQAGAGAIIQPGGGKRDAEVIAAADEHGLAMTLTGMRHFRH